MPEFTTSSSQTDAQREYLESLKKESKPEAEPTTPPTPTAPAEPQPVVNTVNAIEDIDNAGMERFATLEPESVSDISSEKMTTEQALETLREFDPALYRKYKENLERKDRENKLQQSREAQREKEQGTVRVNTNSIPAEDWRSRMSKRLGFTKDKSMPKWFKILEKNISRPAVIGLTSFKGGCGKTTISAVVAAVLQRARVDDRIIVVDFDPSGNLANRAKTKQSSDIQRYARALERGNSDPRPFTITTADGVDMIGSRMDPQEPELTVHDVVRVVEALQEYYDLIVVDMPIMSSSTSYQAMLLMLDAMGFVFEAKEDALDTVDNVENILKGNSSDYLLDKTALLFNHTNKEEDPDFQLGPLKNHLWKEENKDYEILEIPYDPYLFKAKTLEGDLIPTEKYKKFVSLAAIFIHAIEKVRSVDKPTLKGVQ